MTKAECNKRITDARYELAQLREAIKSNDPEKVAHAASEVETTSQEAVNAGLLRFDLSF